MSWILFTFEMNIKLTASIAYEYKTKLLKQYVNIYIVQIYIIYYMAVKETNCGHKFWIIDTGKKKQLLFVGDK